MLVRCPPQRAAAAASSTTAGQDRQRRRRRHGAGVAGRAVARPGAGARGVRRVGGQDRSGARAPPDAGCRLRTLVLASRRRTSWPSCRPRSVTGSARTARSRLAWRGSAKLDVDTVGSVDTGRRLPAVVAAGCSSTRTARRSPRSAGSSASSTRLLDEHGTTLRDESGIGPIAAATLVVEVGDPFRFASESKFARWCGTGAVALSSGEGSGTPVRHRLDYGGNRRINSVLYIASVTQQRAQQRRPHLPRPQARQRARPAAQPAEPTSDTSPTASSDACGKTNHDDTNEHSPPAA